MLFAAQSLFEGYGNQTETVSSIRDVQLLANTIMNQFHIILRDQLMNDLKHVTSIHFSLTSLQMWLVLMVFGDNST
jgi:hypothetical protein